MNEKHHQQRKGMSDLSHYTEFAPSSYLRRKRKQTEIRTGWMLVLSLHGTSYRESRRPSESVARCEAQTGLPEEMGEPQRRQRGIYKTIRKIMDYGGYMGAIIGLIIGLVIGTTFGIMITALIAVNGGDK
jgi:hypothetical protein